jgi:cell shape-determining protein MreC
MYPRGLPVGTITRIEASSSSAAFSRVLVAPAGGLERSRALLVLQVDREAPPKPAAEKDDGRRGQRAKDKGKPR